MRLLELVKLVKLIKLLVKNKNLLDIKEFKKID